MAKINGTSMILKWGGNQIAHLITNSLTIDKNVIDVTDKDSAGWFEGLATGDKNWSVEGELHWDAASATGVPKLITDCIANTNATVYFGETSTGGKYYSGTGIIQNISVSAPNNDKASATVTIQGTGALTEATA